MKRIVYAHVAVFLLLATWIIPPFSTLWTHIDYHAFRFFNSWIAESFLSQQFWGFASTHTFDWIHDVIMFFFLLPYLKNGPKAEMAKRISSVLYLVLATGLTISVVNKTIFPQAFNIKRSSPSAIYEDAVRLKDKVEWVRVKDKSSRSYPGDHGATACAFGYTIFFLMGWRRGLLISPYVFFFCLPRLIAGAHWITDIVMGSLCIMIISLTWATSTPFYQFATQKMAAGLQYLFNRRIRHETL